MDAILSGHAGVALLLDGPALASLHAGKSGDPIPRRPEDIHHLLAGARDLEFLADVEIPQVALHLDLASKRIDALHLTLILLDRELSDRTRIQAARELEELLAHEEIQVFLERILYAQPLPTGADLDGALRCCSLHTVQSVEFIRTLGSLQSTIAHVCLEWDAERRRISDLEEDLAQQRSIAARQGIFRGLVLSVAGSAPEAKLPVRRSGDLRPAANWTWRRRAPTSNSASPAPGAADIALVGAVERVSSPNQPSSDQFRGCSPLASRGRSEQASPISYSSHSKEHPHWEDFAGFLSGISRNTDIMRHLLAECPTCRELLLFHGWDGRRLESLLRLGTVGPLETLMPAEGRDNNYDLAFARAETALADFLTSDRPNTAALESLLSELTALPKDEQIRAVDGKERFQVPQLAHSLLAYSHAARYEDPERMLHLARLAQVVAEACTAATTGNERRLADLRAKSWGGFGNALRVSGRLHEAEEVLAKAQDYLKQGTRDPLLRARLLEQVASLSTFERRFDQAILLATQAEGLYRDLGEMHQVASVLVQKAIAQLYSGEPELAIRSLNQALPFIDHEEEPHLLLAACHNLVRGYIDLDQPEQGLAIYFKTRELYSEFKDSLILLRAAWQEGQLLRDLGHLHAAEAALLRARKGFLERGLAYEVAVVSLDLASVYVKLGAVTQLKEIAAETMPIFRSLRVGREALSALLQLQQVAEHEKDVKILLNLIQRLQVNLGHPKYLGK